MGMGDWMLGASGMCVRCRMGDLLLLWSPAVNAKCSDEHKCFCACVLSEGIRQDRAMSHSAEAAASVPS